MDRRLDDLLHFLIENRTVTVSGEKLAGDFGVSHSTVLHWINRLREFGVEIRGEPFTGFRLERLPDIVLPSLIRHRLGTRALGRTFHHFYELDSTNVTAAQWLADDRNLPSGALFLAESQKAGKGRQGRSWHSEFGTGLYFSLVLRPRLAAAHVPLITLAAAVAVHDAIERVSHVEADIKWPNDILVGTRKVCGILAEMQAEVDRVQSVILGIGINVNQAAFPDDIAERASSLRIVTGRVQSRLEVLCSVLEAFEDLLDALVSSGPEPITSGWTSRSSFAWGRRIEVHDGLRRVEGVTRGLNATGALRVEGEGGRIEDVYSGDVMAWE